jgi:hypothetical protein
MGGEDNGDESGGLLSGKPLMECRSHLAFCSQFCSQ